MRKLVHLSDRANDILPVFRSAVAKTPIDISDHRSFLDVSACRDFFASSPCPAAAGAARTLLSWHADPLYTDVMSETATLDTESEILEQVIESDTAGMLPEAAQALLRFRFNTAAVARMNELVEKNRHGTIAPSERALLERYLRVGNFLNLIHAKARCALAAPASPAS